MCSCSAVNVASAIAATLDVIVVGGGHAGCEAASALARKHPHAFLTDRFSPGYGEFR